MEAQIARLETHLKHLQSDVTDIKADIKSMRGAGFWLFIVTWGGIIASAVGMAWLLARGFGWV